MNWNPRDLPLTRSMKIPAGVLTNFGKQLLEFEEEGGSPGHVSRKA